MHDRCKFEFSGQRAPNAEQLHVGTGVASLSSNERLELYMHGQRTPKAKQVHAGASVVSSSSNERLKLYMHERLLLRYVNTCTS